MPKSHLYDDDVLVIGLGRFGSAIAATLVIISLLVLAAGASPFSVFYLVARGAAGTQFAARETLTRATPLIFTGLAVAVAFRAKLWNIGAEAQRRGVDELVVVGETARPMADVAPAGGTRIRWVADADEAEALLRAELAPPDVVLFKSSRDAGLRWLGDRLTTTDHDPQEDPR